MLGRTIVAAVVLSGITTVATFGALPGPTASAAPGVTCTSPVGPPPAADTSGGFHGMIPERLVDTRQAVPVGAGCWLRVAVPASVPARAQAVALTVTADRAAAAGYLTAHSCGSSLPGLSNLNVRPSGPTSNLAVVAVDATREVCIFSDGGTDVIVDLIGWFGPDGAPFQELPPRRALDTRDPNRRPASLTGAPAPGQVVEVSRSVLGVPAAAEAVMVNLTVTEATGPGYLTAWPCPGARPNTSNVNYDTGVDRANSTVMALGPTGSLCVEVAEAAAHVIVDVNGWLGGSTGLEYSSRTGRVADSRDGTGGWSGPFEAGETRALDPAPALPGGSRVALLGVVATETEGAGFLAVRPCGDMTEVSSLNYVAGADISNLVAVPLADDGTVCVTASERTHVVVDVFGGFRADGLLRSLTFAGADLEPAFEPAIHDYVAYCTSANDNDLALDVVGMPNTTVRIDGGPPAIRIDTTVTKAADEAVVIVVTPAAGAPEQYWIRCLPTDFPRISVNRPGTPAPGWYLLTTDEFGMILNTDGVPVWYRRADEPARNPRNLMRLDDGTLAWFQDRGFAIGIDPDDGYERFTLDGAPVPPLLRTVGYPTNHHDMVELPNGNFLVMAMPSEPAPPGVSCRVNPAPFPVATADRVAGAVIQEITPAGALVKEFDAADAGIGLDENTVPLCFRTSAGVDYLTSVHINGLSASADGETVIFSARHHDAVYALDWSQDPPVVTWKLGGTDEPASLDVVGDPLVGPRRQHDVQVLPNGNVSMFDNRTPFSFATLPTSGPARYVEYELDEAAGTATLVREVRRSNGDTSGALGSARPLSGGGVLLNWGAVPGPVFTEVGSTGATVFEVSLAPFSPSYRTIKEPLAAFDIDELRATAGR